MTEDINDVLDLDVSDPGDDRQWLILYDEDYDSLMLDQTDQVALLLNERQAFVLFRLSVTALNGLADLDMDTEEMFDAE